jgi:hypothetical protein
LTEDGSTKFDSKWRSGTRLPTNGFGQPATAINIGKLRM